MGFEKVNPFNFRNH